MGSAAILPPVTGSAQRALLFLDVDGPFIPFGAAPQSYPTYAMDPELSDADANPLLTRIDPEHGARLTALPCEVVWATTWMADANECIAPHIGLPQLPVVVWPEPSDIDDQDERNGLHWKTRTLVEWAAGRPFAWVDDEVTDTDRSWVAAHHQGQALLHRVDARRGLTDSDYAALDSWLRDPRRARVRNARGRGAGGDRGSGAAAREVEERGLGVSIGGGRGDRSEGAGSHEALVVGDQRRVGAGDRIGVEGLVAARGAGQVPGVAQQFEGAEHLDGTLHRDRAQRAAG
jgi:hypothetical protein